MPNRVHQVHPFLASLRSAVLAAMQERGHKQDDVADRTGMPQSQISRFLSGGGKRMTPHLDALCVYADIQPKSHSSASGARGELSQLLSQVIGDNAAAARALLVVVKALAPALQNMPDRNARRGRAT